MIILFTAECASHRSLKIGQYLMKFKKQFIFDHHVHTTYSVYESFALILMQLFVTRYSVLLVV